MRIHIPLDEMPEFDSYASMTNCLRGIAWSLTNTSLSEPIPSDVMDTLIEALRDINETLDPFKAQEHAELTSRRALQRRYQIGDDPHD